VSAGTFGLSNLKVSSPPPPPCVTCCVATSLYSLLRMFSLSLARSLSLALALALDLSFSFSLSRARSLSLAIPVISSFPQLPQSHPCGLRSSESPSLSRPLYRRPCPPADEATAYGVRMACVCSMCQALRLYGLWSWARASA